MWNGITLIAGILLLYLGAEWLIKGAAGLGRSFGIRPLVIGLTVVAYGTSAPEFVVGVVAGAKGMNNLVLGNVIGSNLANLGLVLGMTAMLAPLAVDGSLIRREAPVMFVTSLLIPILLLDGVVSRAEGLILLLIAAIFTVRDGAIFGAREGRSEARPQHPGIRRGGGRRASGTKPAPPDRHRPVRPGICWWPAGRRLWTARPAWLSLLE